MKCDYCGKDGATPSLHGEWLQDGTFKFYNLCKDCRIEEETTTYDEELALGRQIRYFEKDVLKEINKNNGSTSTKIGETE